MVRSITTEHLEKYVADTLSPTVRRRVESALRESQQLRRELDELKAEAGIVDEVKDSLSIRLPERDEARSVSKAVGRLKTTLSKPDR